MAEYSQLAAELARYWRYGALPEDQSGANRFRTLADAVLDRAGAHRILIRTEPQKHMERIGGILEELEGNGAYRGLILSCQGIHSPALLESKLVKPMLKGKQLLEDWQNRAKSASAASTEITRWYNLEIGFERGPAGNWETRARTSFRRGEGIFDPPFSIGELVAFSANLKKAVAQGHPLLGQGDLEGALFELGRTLWESLMQGSTRDCYTELVGVIKQTPLAGIRICLSFGPLDRNRLLLRQIPWEWLNKGEDFASLDPATTLLRSVPTSLPEHPIKVSSTPTVLFVGFSCLASQSRAAITQIKNALGYEPDVLMDPRYKELTLALEKRPYDIFHYAGHGRRNPKTGRGELQLLSRSKEDWAWVGAGELAPRLNRNGVRCVLLNACESAVQDDQVLFHTAAEELLLTGIPTVIAMRGRLTLEATTSFTYHFYRELEKNQSLETALGTARRAVKIDMGTAFDWHLPVLLINEHA